VIGSLIPIIPHGASVRLQRLTGRAEARKGRSSFSRTAGGGSTKALSENCAGPNELCPLPRILPCPPLHAALDTSRPGACNRHRLPTRIAARVKMRTMVRRLFTALSVLSFLLCLAMAAMWIRSYAAYDQVGCWNVSRARMRTLRLELQSWRGGIVFRHEVMSATDEREWSIIAFSDGESGTRYYYEGPDWPVNTLIRETLLDRSNVLGFGMDREQDPNNHRGLFQDRLDVEFPYWSVVVLTSAPCAVWLARRLRHQRRRAAHCCISCGYNLTGNTSGVCPECGIAPSKLGRGG
jgi:hypothetical protein